jgi:hypothetical protein
LREAGILGWEQSRFLLIVYSGPVGFLQTPSGGRGAPARRLLRERLLDARRISFGKNTLPMANDPASGSHRTEPVLLREVWRCRVGSSFNFHLRVGGGQGAASRTPFDNSPSKTRVLSGAPAAGRPASGGFAVSRKSAACILRTPHCRWSSKEVKVSSEISMSKERTLVGVGG